MEEPVIDKKQDITQIVEQALIEILKNRPDLLQEIRGKYAWENLATKDDIKLLINLIDKRFEAVDKRFEAVDKRFEAVDKRFEDLIHYIDKRFEDLIHYIDKRFAQVDKRLSLIQWVMTGVIGTVFIGILAIVVKLFTH